jgi:hypothetical protein
MAATPERQLRLLIADVATDETKRILSDQDVTDFLELNAGNVKLAAADALDAIATSEVLVAKVIRTQDLATDGAKVAATLQARAASLRNQAVAEDPDADYFDLSGGDCVPEHTNYPTQPWHAWGL